MVDRWADKGRDTEMEPRCTSLRQSPIFAWTSSGIAHCSTMSKVVITWAHLMAARLQIHEHDNLAAKFSRDKGTADWSLEITGNTNESVSEPSAASSKALASTPRAPRISRNGAGRKRTNADYVSPFTRSSPPSWNAWGTYQAIAKPCSSQG